MSRFWREYAITTVDQDHDAEEREWVVSAYNAPQAESVVKGLAAQRGWAVRVTETRLRTEDDAA